MTLKSKLQSELLAQTGPGPRSLVAREGEELLVCELAGLNALAVELLSLKLTTPRLATASIERLGEISRALADRVTYLLEPVGPVELDAEAATVQMRSVPPSYEEDAATYYEILVRRGGEVALCRYQKTPSEPRRIIPAIITREVLFRLAEDFGAVVSE